jgi:predicted  nucleic acid-binding Zn-ribbon protein
MAAEAPVSTSLSEEEKLRGQVDFLRNVVSNQHDVMHELRQLLEDHGDDSDELQAVMRKLGDAEKQGIELQRHLDEMEKEHVRIRLAAKESGRKQTDAVSPDSDMLRNLVGNQQRTIGNLQNLLRNLPSDSGKAKELDDVINKIQRTNNDLSSCVMVLEDENDHLREKVESLQKRVADLESAVAAVPETIAIPAPAVDTATTDMPTDVAPAQEVNTDADEFDVDALLAASAPIAEPAAIDPAEREDDADALLDTAGADIEAKPAVSEPMADDIAEDVDLAQEISADTDEFDVDALLAASGPVAKPAAIDPATSDDDIDALLDAAAADSKKKAAVSEPVTDTDAVEKPVAVDPAQDVSPDTDDIDALLADLFAHNNKTDDDSKS